jgi:type IV secretory pathway component VirB8
MLSKKRTHASGPSLPSTVEAASQGSPGYPKDYSVGALRERRLLMVVRTLGFCLLSSIIVIMVMAFLLVSLMPLKEIRPFLVRVADEGTVVASIMPIQDTFEAKDILTEKLVREYVVNRHEILRSEEVMIDRWNGDGYLGLTSSPEEYARFAEPNIELIEKLRSADATRRANIISVSAVRAGSVYIVDFESKSYDANDGLVDNRIYSATVDIEFRPLSDLTREQMLINPTGFTVVNYSLAEKKQ